MEKLEAIEQTLNQILLTNCNLTSDTALNPSSENQKLSISELADYLDVSKSTIHRYKNNRVLPFYQAGRTVYFKKNEIDKSIKAFTSKKSKMF